MKRYLAFSGSHYYANGGMGDFISDHDTLPTAVQALFSHVAQLETETSKIWGTYRWGEIYDTDERRIVWTDRTARL